MCIRDSYSAAQQPYQRALAARGLTPAEIGSHAGAADTSLMLALDPTLVRTDVAATRPRDAADGVNGDPRRASAELGRLGVARVSTATRLATVAFSAAYDAAKRLQSSGRFDGLDSTLAYGNIQGLFTNSG